jgi:hypothetical protein
VPLRSFLMSSILALAIIGSSVPPVTAMAQEAAPAATLMAEVRHSFALNGKAIPPEIFRDFGDGDLADSERSIWVTVDLKAAIGSNLYFDEIKQDGRWISQQKAGSMKRSGTPIWGRQITACSSSWPYSIVAAPVALPIYISSISLPLALSIPTATSTNA